MNLTSLAIMPPALLLGAILAIGVLAPPLPPGVELIEPPIRPDGLFYEPLATRYPDRVTFNVTDSSREFVFGKLWDGPAEIHWQESVGFIYRTFGKTSHTDGMTMRRYSGTSDFSGQMVRALVYPADTSPKPLVLYRFDEVGGNAIWDRSRSASPVNLIISDTNSVDHLKSGFRIREPVLIASGTNTGTMINALKKSQEITIIAVLRTASLTQSGPARVLTLSDGNDRRNFTLGQIGDAWQVRLRTTATTVNGIAFLQSPNGAVTTDEARVVYTRDISGTALLRVNGWIVAETSLKGDFSNWADGYRLGIGNELNGERPWLGTLRLLAVFDKALTLEEQDAVK
jgi:hypothetical protein